MFRAVALRRPFCYVVEEGRDCKVGEWVSHGIGAMLYTSASGSFAHLLERRWSNLCTDVAGQSPDNLCSTAPLLETKDGRDVATRQQRGATRGEGNYSIFRIGYWGIWFLKRVCIPGVLGLFYIRGILGFLFVQGFLR